MLTNDCFSSGTAFRDVLTSHVPCDRVSHPLDYSESYRIVPAASTMGVYTVAIIISVGYMDRPTRPGYAVAAVSRWHEVVPVASYRRGRLDAEAVS